MKLIIGGLLLLGVVSGSAGFMFMHGNGQAATNFRTAPLERGNLMAVIAATGVVQAENVIDVGAQNQIPCKIVSFGPDLLRNPKKTIDFRSPVTKGMVLAKLDDAVYGSQLEQAQAEVDQAKANVQRADADLLQMQAKLVQCDREMYRVKRLMGSKGVVSDLDFDIVQANFETARATLTVGKAAQVQAQKALAKMEAALRQAEINLSYCTIRATEDGVIIDRRVNVGQTVVSSLNAPSLFLIATDIKRLEVWAAVNEADIGNITWGQKVRFTVDAYPTEPFEGTVTEIRLNAQMTQNVVTYPVVVSVDNSNGKLLPYMTANLQFQVGQRDDAMLAPNGALRWRPQLPQVHPDVREDYARSLKPAPAGGKAGAPEKDRQVWGRVWLQDGEFVRPIKVRVGLTDGSLTEVSAPELSEGAELIVGVHQAAGADGTVNPFAPQMIQRPKTK
ncbi:MAG: efflux RND transporter periplasmic adaptor subunit [Gemmataceae bacterium]|nr:efflux RND transporter periplasmic adaptor subunit [Gemmataceae bacterium]